MKGTLDITRRVFRWRAIVFATTWVAYASFYLTRKNYSVAQPAFMEEYGWTRQDVGLIVTAYLTAYAIGQFGNGVLADRLGSRRMLALGFALTVTMSVALGMVGAVAAMAVLYGINGYAQSTGWPSVTRAMANWFPVAVRGRVMGWWGTNYPVGDAAATALAAFVLAAWGWRAAFWLPAVAAAVIGVVVVLLLRDRPEDVGLPGGDGDTGGADAEIPDESPGAGQGAAVALPLRVVLGDVRVWTLAGAYFCLKFVRYTFIFWIGIWFVEEHGFSVAEAGMLQVAFPLAGVAGTVFSGWLSDRFFDARRAPVAVGMLVGLMIALFVFLGLPGDGLLLAIGMGAIGFLLYGPDMLVAGTAAMDFGSRHAAATVAGFVNGSGSVGAALSGVVVAAVADAWGWSAVFYLLMAMAIACAAVMATLWNARGDDAPPSAFSRARQ